MTFTNPCQSRNWCFTDFELLNWEEIYKNYKDIIRYICWGTETCPKTNKTHLQGWIQFVNKKRLNGIKKVCQSNKLHLESCRGTQEQNDKYCKKDNKYKTIGTYIKQGQRTDLEHIKKKIADGCSMRDIAEENFQLFVQYGNGLEKYKKIIEQEKRKEFRHVEVIHIHGSTGKGKTRLAMVDSKYKIQGDQLQWWDGYEGEKTICIDEYDNSVNITKILSILDGYQLRLPIKGGFTYANWNKVYITSNYEKLHKSYL